MKLTDTSAWHWSRRQPSLRARFDQSLSGRQIAVCDMVKLELLETARNATEFGALAEELERLPQCPITVEAWKRAIWVYGELAKQGGAHQRSVQHADLLIAAAAESAGVAVLHYDEAYERSARITGQPCEWLAPRGTLA
jgi:predicted nucleic acid-binding protein